MTAHVARNPDYAALIRDAVARMPYMTTLGASVAHVAPGEVDIALAFDAKLTQQNGFLHAGALASIGDTACGAAALSLAPPAHDVLAVEFKINLMRPAAAPRFVACARVLRAGKTLSVVFAEIFGESAEGRQCVASMLATMTTRPAG